MVSYGFGDEVPMHRSDSVEGGGRRPGSTAVPWVLCVVLVVALAAGCSTEEPLPPRDGEQETTEDSRRVGSLLAEFEHSGADDRPVQIHAQFLDIRGVEADRARRALEVWSARRELDRDACSLRSTPGPAAGAEGDMELDLLSVGPIEVEGPDRDLQLEARRLPDVVTSFSGVIYGTEGSFETPERERLQFEPGEQYTFRAEGDGATGGFRATLEAPEPLHIEHLSGQSEMDGSGVVLREGSEFRFRWPSAETADGEVFFDISTGHEPDQPHLKCRLEDDGGFSVPADLVAQLARASDTLRVSLRRVNSSKVDIPGLQEARFTVSAVDHLSVHVR